MRSLLADVWEILVFLDQIKEEDGGWRMTSDDARGRESAREKGTPGPPPAGLSPPLRVSGLK